MRNVEMVGRNSPFFVLRRVSALAVGITVAWWLFADTYARHVGSAGDANLIRFSHFGTYQDYELWREIIGEFEQDNPEQRVRQEYVVGLADRYNTKMRQQALSRTLPDVALMQLGPFRDLATCFSDMTEFGSNVPEGGIALSESLDVGGLGAFVFEGRRRGLPVSGGNLLIYANVKCFERADEFYGRSIPRPTADWTMEDFRRTAELLTIDFDGDDRIDQFGFWLPRWIYYLPFIWSFGAELTDESHTSWQLVGPEAESVLNYYRDMAVDRRVCPRDDEVPQLFQDTGFITGKVAMCVNGPWFQPFLAKTSLARSYLVAPIPRGPNGSVTRITWDGVVLADGLSPERRAQALRFIRYILSKPVQDRIARTGRALPARIESLGSFVDLAGDVRRKRFIEAVETSRLQPPLPRFGEVDRAINRHFGRVLDPAIEFDAGRILDALAQDPAIERAFPGDGVGAVNP